MIQRIQTLFLILAATSLGFMHYFNFFTASGPVQGGEKTVHINITAANMASPTEGATFQEATSQGLVILSFLTILLAIIAIFLFKRRKWQIRLCFLVAIFSLIMLGLALNLVMEGRGIMEEIPTDQRTLAYGLGLFMPLFAAIFALQARAAIRKDQKRIYAADRLR